VGQIVYLADETDADDLDTTFRVMASRGVHARRVHPERLALDIDRSGAFSAFCAGESLRPDLWVGWVFEDLLAPGLAILDALEACGAPVVNPGAVMFRGQNKFLMSALLNAAKVPHLPVRLAGTYADLLRAANELGFPLVVKPGLVVCGGYTRQTAGGKGVTGPTTGRPSKESRTRCSASGSRSTYSR
jgi:hypothetical protein